MDSTTVRQYSSQNSIRLFFRNCRDAVSKKPENWRIGELAQGYDVIILAETCLNLHHDF